MPCLLIWPMIEHMFEDTCGRAHTRSTAQARSGAQRCTAASTSEARALVP